MIYPPPPHFLHFFEAFCFSLYNPYQININWVRILRLFLFSRFPPPGGLFDFLCDPSRNINPSPSDPYQLSSQSFRS